MKQNKKPKNEYIRKPVDKTNPYKDDVLYTDQGQWQYPGQVTKIPSGDITMEGVPYPVMGIDNLGNQQVMMPNMNYHFPGQHVTEYPVDLRIRGNLKNLRGSVGANFGSNRVELNMATPTNKFDPSFGVKYARTFAQGGLLNKTLTCPNCGWSWKAVDGGKDIATCHKCGSTVKMAYGGDPSLPDLTGHYQGGGNNRPMAESTFVAKPLINLPVDDGLGKNSMFNRGHENYDYAYAKDLLKKYNVDVDSTGNVLEKIGLPSVAYYNPITRTINYKHDPKENKKDEYTKMVMKEIPHAIQADSLGTFPFLKNVITEGLEDVWKNNNDARYYDESKIEGHAHNTLEAKLWKEKRAKRADYAVKNFKKSQDSKSLSQKKQGGWLDTYPFGGRFTKTHTHMDNGGSNKVQPLNLKKNIAVPETSGMRYTEYPTLDTLRREEATRLKRPWNQWTEEEKQRYIAHPPKNMTDAQAEQWNQRAQEMSAKQAKKEYIDQYAIKGNEKLIKNPVLPIAASFTPPGAIISLTKGAINLAPDIYKVFKNPTSAGNYVNVADDLLSMGHISGTNLGSQLIKRIKDTKILSAAGHTDNFNIGDIKRVYGMEKKFQKNIEEENPDKTMKYGGWLDEYTDEYRRGGSLYTPPGLKKKVRQKGTSKNIVSSINKLFTRNYDLFGPSGKAIYNPNSKYQSGGGWLDNLD